MGQMQSQAQQQPGMCCEVMTPGGCALGYPPPASPMGAGAMLQSAFGMPNCQSPNNTCNGVEQQCAGLTPAAAPAPAPEREIKECGSPEPFPSSPEAFPSSPEQYASYAS